MATTTPNFGWSVPTSTDLVKDGATAIETLGDSIDASLVDLKGGTTGQVLSKNSNTDMDFVWAAATSGDITGVTAGTGISGGGTSGDVTVTNSMATAITTAGDVIYGTGSGTFTRLGIGTAGQQLSVNSGATAPEWKTVTAGAYTTIVAETAFGSVTGVTISSIAGTYKNLVLVISNVSFNNNDRLLVRPNSSSANSPSSTMVEGNSGETVTTNAKAQWQVNFNLLSPSSTDNSWVCEFPNYAQASAKIMRFNGAYVSTAASCSIVGSAAWFNTTAISSLNIKSESGNTFDSGTYALYGVN